MEVVVVVVVVVVLGLEVGMVGGSTRIRSSSSVGKLPPEPSS